MADFKDPSPARQRSPALSASEGSCPPGDVACLRSRVATFPREPGVYLWKNASGDVLYVGKAIDLRARVRSYVTGAQTDKTRQMVSEASSVEFIATHSEKEALILEQTLIKKERPPYNVLLTDDKKYPYIMVTEEEFPRVVYTRETGGAAAVFGPFPDAYAAKWITRLLNESFKLRQCRSLPKRACIYHQMGQCLAPCITAVPDEVYRDAADDARAFLKGRGRALAKDLDGRMKKAADGMRFEEAAYLRDTKSAVESVMERQRVFAQNVEDRDALGLSRRGDRACVAVLFIRDGRVVGRESYFLSHAQDVDDAEVLGAFVSQYYGTALAVPGEILVNAPPTDADALLGLLREKRGGAVHFHVPQRGEKRRVLEMASKNADLIMAEDHFRRERDAGGGVPELQALLKMDNPPHTIDGFDISHHGGSHTVASMVRFRGGKPHKEMYRHYRIREVQGIDDFASMKEAVTRRFRGLVERGQEMPDLVLIDGGRGQLNAALAALHALGLSEQPVVSLAKREEEIYTPLTLHPIRVPAGHDGRRLLERVRDEAHRFAIKYQDTLKRGALTKSALLAIPGVGPKRLRELLKRFGSIQGIAAAPVDDLRKVPGVTQEVADAIKAVAVAAQAESGSSASRSNSNPDTGTLIS